LPDAEKGKPVMKRFRFTLQSVLDIKEKTEENEKRVLYGLKTQMSELQNELHCLEELYKKYADERGALSANGISVAELTRYCNYLKELEGRQKQKQSEIDTLQERIDRQTEVLKKLSIEVKALVKLKEAQYALYGKLADRENERLIEDFIAAKA